jgi:hypothetical protein
MATLGSSRATRVMTPTVLVGLVLAFVGVLLFSFSVPMTKVAVGGFSPYFTAIGRAVIAGVLAVVLLAIRRDALPPREHLTPILGQARERERSRRSPGGVTPRACAPAAA